MSYFVFKMKRWWVMAVLGTLSLSLTHCANKRSSYVQNGGVGYGTCSGAMGNFYVTIQPIDGNYTYILLLEPQSGIVPGDIASVYINSGSGFRLVLPQAVVNPGEVLTAGPVTAQDLEQYDYLTVTPYSPNPNFFAGDASQDTYCYIPQPGQTE